MRSAVGIRTRSQKRREQEPGSREPPAAACRSPQSASFFSEDSVLAPSLSRKNEVKPPVHRVRQRDLLCGDLLALPDAGPGSLRLPQEPAPRGLFSPGKHRRGGSARVGVGARSSSLLRDLLSLLPSLRAGAGRGRTGGGSKPSPAGALQRSDGGGRDPGSLLLPGGRVNKVPGSMRRRDRAQGQWPCSRTRIRACWDGLGHLPVGKQRRVTAVRQPLGPHWVKLHRHPPPSSAPSRGN